MAPFLGKKWCYFSKEMAPFHVIKWRPFLQHLLAMFFGLKPFKLFNTRAYSLFFSTFDRSMHRGNSS